MILTKAIVEQMDEATLRKRVLLPLLLAMGYSGVSEYHGPNELGKDIIAHKADDLGGRNNLALVVKAKKITGNTNESARTQIEQCFGAPFIDPQTGEEELVHRCWVVTNKPAISGATNSIVSSLRTRNLHLAVRFIHLDELWQLIEHHLPVQGVFARFKELADDLDTIDDHFRPIPMQTSGGMEIAITEKYPGAAIASPLTFNTQFAFPNTPEGRAAQESLQRHFATGAPVKIPGEFVQSIQFPELLHKLSLTDGITVTQIEIGTAKRNKPILVQIEFSNERDAPIVFPYIDLRVSQAGREELTLRNTDQPIPAQVTLRLLPQQRLGQISLDFSTRPINVEWYLRALECERCMTLPFTVRILDVNSGLPLVEMHPPAAVEKERETDEIFALQALVAIQEHTGTQINIPDSQLCNDDIETIGRLYGVWRNGLLTGRWRHARLAFPRPVARQIVEVFKDGQPHPHWLTKPGVEHLFGAALGLGMTTTLYPEAMLLNIEAAITELRDAGDEGEDICLEFVPGPENRMAIYYHDWLPGPPYEGSQTE